jgi:hypothetical protein
MENLLSGCFFRKKDKYSGEDRERFTGVTTIIFSIGTQVNGFEALAPLRVTLDYKRSLSPLA